MKSTKLLIDSRVIRCLTRTPFSAVQLLTVLRPRKS